MVWSTRHYQWLTFLKDGLELCFENQKEVFVAGDLMWYPVEGRPDICVGPDIMVAFGPGKGDRESYRQWEEGGIAPQVVIEILSHGNTAKEMVNKMAFYNRHGVQEYLIFDPEDTLLQAWCRDASGGLKEVAETQGWRSPTLGITFWTAPGTMHAILPDGSRMRTRAEDAARADMEHDRADAEKVRAETANARAESEKVRADEESRLASRLAAKLKELGIDPDTI
jgi:Uma2 family endonuclease